MKPLFPLLLGVATVLVPLTAHAAEFVVASAEDDGSETSLRRAINFVNNSPGADTIRFAESVFTPNERKTIFLQSALPAITSDVEITGPKSGVEVRGDSDFGDGDFGDGDFGIFSVRNGTVSFTGLTIKGGVGKNGASDDSGTGRGGTGEAGGLTITGGTVSLVGCTLNGNRGGIGGTGNPGRRVSQGQFGGTGGAGAIQVSGGTLSVTNCTFVGNMGGIGGMGGRGGNGDNNAANFNGGNGGNGGGGAVGINGGRATFFNATFASNTGAAGGAGGPFGTGGPFNLGNPSQAGVTGADCVFLNMGSATTTNSIYSTSSGATLISIGQASFVSGGGNISTDGGGGLLTGTGDLINTNPILEMGLEDNGGPTQTLAILTGSPAINKASGAPATDQRGYGRVDAADSGAFEFKGTLPNVAPTVSDLAASTNEDTDLVFGSALFDGGFTDADGDTLQSVTIVSLPANGTLVRRYSESNHIFLVRVGDEILRDELDSLTYIPGNNFNGGDSFNYNASDGKVKAATGATVNITVTAVNDAPVAASQQFTVNADASFSEQLVATDVDDDAATLRYSVRQQPTKGIVTINTNGRFTYKANADTSGPDSFTFVANDGDDDSQPATVSITIKEVPLVAATDLAATAGNSQINLTWKDNSDRETGYEVERAIDDNKSASERIFRGTTANQTSYADKTAQLGVRYVYRVRPYKTGLEVDSEFSNSASATVTEDAFAAPTQLRVALGRDKKSVNLMWNANAAGETGTLVYRRVGDGGFMLIFRGTTPGQNSYTDTRPQSGALNTYRVFSYVAGESIGQGSNIAGYNVPADTSLAAATRLRATASGSRIVLSWIDNATAETGYKIYRRVDGSSQLSEIFRGTVANQTSYSDTNTVLGTTYVYFVLPYQVGTNGAASNLATATAGPPLKVMAPSSVKAAQSPSGGSS